ncbi:MAG TPA: hypothetical protein VG265_07340 [Gaiellaceae bacterium]|nr:hypothetical protein [Gaiellaceae bacterium]
MSTTNQVTVPSSPGTILFGPDGNYRTVVIENLGTCAVYVGPAGVTTSTGYKVAVSTDPQDSVEINLDPTDEFVAVAPTSLSGLIAYQVNQ